MMEDVARRPDAERYMKKLDNVYFAGGECHSISPSLSRKLYLL